MQTHLSLRLFISPMCFPKKQNDTWKPFSLPSEPKFWPERQTARNVLSPHDTFSSCLLCFVKWPSSARAFSPCLGLRQALGCIVSCCPLRAVLRWQVGTLGLDFLPPEFSFSGAAATLNGFRISSSASPRGQGVLLNSEGSRFLFVVIWILWQWSWAAPLPAVCTSRSAYPFLWSRGQGFCLSGHVTLVLSLREMGRCEGKIV